MNGLGMDSYAKIVLGIKENRSAGGRGEKRSGQGEQEASRRAASGHASRAEEAEQGRSADEGKESRGRAEKTGGQGRLVRRQRRGKGEAKRSRLPQPRSPRRGRRGRRSGRPTADPAGLGATTTRKAKAERSEATTDETLHGGGRRRTRWWRWTRLWNVSGLRIKQKPCQIVVYLARFFAGSRRWEKLWNVSGLGIKQKTCQKFFIWHVFCRTMAMDKTMECIWVGNMIDGGDGQDYGMYLGWGYD